MPLRAPHLHESLRAFCLAAFAAERGAELPFSFDEHPSHEGPSFYAYRPLVASFVEEQAPTLRRLPDTRNAIDDLRREPAAAIYAHTRSGLATGADDALFRTILMPLLTAVAEGSGGFDWHDDAFATAYAALERSLYGSERSYAAVAPLVGVSAGAAVDLGEGIQVRHVVPGEVSSLWPDAERMMPPEFGRDTDRLCVLELVRELDAGADEPPDAASELADAVSALRLATAGAIAAGPLVFERLDFRPLRVSPLLPIAATKPAGEGCRLDAVRGARAAELRARLVLADGDRGLAEALDRWELSLFADEPFASGQVKAALEALLGAGQGVYAAAMRAAVLLAEEPGERVTLAAELRAEHTGPSAREALRRALVATLAHDDRSALLGSLDERLLGLDAAAAGARRLIAVA